MSLDFIQIKVLVQRMICTIYRMHTVGAVSRGHSQPVVERKDGEAGEGVRGRTCNFNTDMLL